MVPVSGKFDEHQASTRQPHPDSLQVSGYPIDREDPKFSQASQGISEDGAQALDLPLKSEGWRLGWFHDKQMVKEFSDAVWTQQIKTVGPYIKSGFGYHIIFVHERDE